MLWRVRTTMPDRPGSLARLAEQCGRADVNILGLQIFPGVEAVTDELVLAHAASDWRAGRRSSGSCERAGWRPGRLRPSARRPPWSTSRPATSRPRGRSWPSRRRSPRCVATLFDAEADPGAGRRWPDPGRDGDDGRRRAGAGAPPRAVHRRPSTRAGRRWPIWSPTCSRGARRRAADAVGGAASRAAPRHRRTSSVTASSRPRSTGTTVGIAPRSGRRPARSGRSRAGRCEVDPAWQRRGIGTRLLVEAARLAALDGAVGGRAEHPRRQPGRPAAGAGRRAAGPDPDVCRAAHGARPGARLRRRPLRLRPRAPPVGSVHE